MTKAMLIDLTRCIGCRGCQAACKQWHVLEEIVGTALHRTRQTLEHHLVEVKLPANLPLIQVDGLLLEQVFVNLLENAARHTPDGTTVTIAATGESKWITITVTDDGPGLLPGTEDRIFDKFYRVQHPDNVVGTGLGLAICKGIVEAHGGSITAENRPGGGTIIRVTLPVADGDSTNAGERA